MRLLLSQVCPHVQMEAHSSTENHALAALFLPISHFNLILAQLAKMDQHLILLRSHASQIHFL
jgi:hypothetical protein